MPSATHETVREMTQGQLKDIAATLIGAIPDLTFEEAKAITGNKRSLVSGVQEVFEMFRTPRPNAAPSLSQPAVQTFTVPVGYAGSKTIAKLVKAGKYDWVNEQITDRNFPAGDRADTENVELCLVHFNRLIDNGDEVVHALDEMGLKPATPAHLLALGAAHKNLQRQFPIAALGQSWGDPGGSHGVVVLGEYVGGRDVHLYWIEYRWYEYWRFLAIRK